MVETSRLFARTAATIDPVWLEPLGGGLCRSSPPRPALGRPARRGGGDRAGHAFRADRSSRGGPSPTGGSGRRRPPTSSSAQALVDGETGHPFAFLRHNQGLAAKRGGSGRPAAAPGPAGLRRGPRGVSTASGFPGCTTSASLAHLIKTQGRGRVPAHVGGRPDELAAGRRGAGPLPGALKAGGALPWSSGIDFEPGSGSHGVTLRVPLALAADGAAPPWNGWCRGSCARRWRPCSRGFPRPLRKRLVPAERDRGRHPA